MTGVEAVRATSLGTIPHGFLGRRGGVSTGDIAGLNVGYGSNDDRAAIFENRKRAVAAVLPDAELVTVRQVHSADAVFAHRAWPQDERPHADAIVTDRPKLLLGILTADCAPVLFADDDAGVIGAAHAGWKGAVGGVLEATLAAMEKLGARRADIRAAIGPCISQANYEVGAEFTRHVDGRFLVPSDRPDHFRFDLEGFAAHRLAEAGITAVQKMGLCTYPEGNGFFSFRRTTHRGEGDYGREISVIVLTE